MKGAGKTARRTLQSPSCHVHQSMRTRHRCDICRRPICHICYESSPIQGLCSTCAKRDASRQKRKALIREFGAPAVVAVATLLLLAILIHDHATQEPAPQPHHQAQSGVSRVATARSHLTFWSESLLRTIAIPPATQVPGPRIQVTPALPDPQPRFMARAPVEIPLQTRDPAPLESAPRDEDRSSSRAIHLPPRTYREQNVVALSPPAQIQPLRLSSKPHSTRPSLHPSPPTRTSGWQSHFLGKNRLTKYHIEQLESLQPTIILTFDGDHLDNCVEPVLSILREKQTKANIFVTGTFIKRYPEHVKAFVALGHEVGNHTWAHPRLTSYRETRTHQTLTQVDRDFMAQQLEQTARAFQAVTGTSMRPYWRAPFGEHNPQIRTWAYALGYLHVGWTRGFDTMDWFENSESRYYWRPEELRKRLMKRLESQNIRRSVIILMHLGSTRPDSDRPYRMLAEFIDQARGAGWTFKTMSEALPAVSSAPEIPSGFAADIQASGLGNP